MGIVLNPFTGQLDITGASATGNTIATYANFAAFPTAASAGNGALAEALDTHIIYVSDGASWLVIAGPADIMDIGTIDSQTKGANGATENANQLIMQSADVTFPGLVNNTTQSFSGNKTFTGTIAASNFSGSSSGTNTGDVTLTAVGSAPSANGASLSGQALTLQPADSTHPGAVTEIAQTFGGLKTFASNLNSAVVTGTTSASGTLTLRSTSDATKGKILVGTSAYDEVNNRLGVGNSTPTVPLDVTGAILGSTTITATTQLISSVATGTAPLVVSSTTQVANLNAATAGSATTATTATNANNVATTQVSNSASYFPLMVSSSTNGNQACDLGTGLTFNPSTNNMTTTTFTGALSGNATTATSATTATTATNATNVATTQVSNSASYFPLMVSSSTNGNQAADLGTGLTFNPSTNNMTTTTFTGALSGNATTATTATNATNVATTAVATNASFYPLFVSSTSNSNQAADLDADLSYNPSTNTLTTTTFSGALSGNATTATTATNATNTAITDDTTTNATMYPTWVTAGTGNLPQKVSTTKLTFNPSTAVLTTTTFVGALTGTASGNIANTLTTTTGDMIYASAANTPARLAAGTTNQYLRSAGAAAPVWTTFTQPTVQVLTGSGTYTTPAGVKRIRITLVGAGGGGANSGSALGAAGNAGSASNTFSIAGGAAILTCTAGAGGGYGNYGGASGTGTNSGSGGATTIWKSNGGNGHGGSMGGLLATVAGGMGAPGLMGQGQGGSSGGQDGQAAKATSGAGGGGAGSSSAAASDYSGGGGGAGGQICADINAPAATYDYNVAATGGTGASAGTNGFAGQSGATGTLIVEEYYQ